MQKRFSAVVAVSGIRQLWRGGGPTSYGYEVYTEGDCWALAYYVARLTGGQVVTLGGDWWEHVAVRVAHNRYLDASGLHNRQQLLHLWRGPIFTLGYPAYPFTRYAEQIKGEFRFLHGPRTAEAFARRLVATERDERLASAA
jgi:hypothetical protein